MSYLARASIVRGPIFDTRLTVDYDGKSIPVERVLYEVELCDGYHTLVEAPLLSSGVSEEYRRGALVYVVFESYNTGTIVAKVSDPIEEYFSSPPTLDPYRLATKGTIFEGKADDSRPVMLHDSAGGYIAVKDGQVSLRTVGRTYVFFGHNSVSMLAPTLTVSSSPVMPTESFLDASGCPYRISNESGALTLSVLVDDTTPKSVAEIKLEKNAVITVKNDFVSIKIDTTGVVLDSSLAKIEMKKTGDVSVRGKSIELGTITEPLLRASFVDILRNIFLNAVTTATTSGEPVVAAIFTQAATSLSLQKELVTTKVVKAG